MDNATPDVSILSLLETQRDKKKEEHLMQTILPTVVPSNFGGLSLTEELTRVYAVRILVDSLWLSDWFRGKERIGRTMGSRSGSQKITDKLQKIHVRYSLPVSSPTGKVEVVSEVLALANQMQTSQNKRSRRRTGRKVRQPVSSRSSISIEVSKVFPILFDKEMAALWTSQDLKLELIHMEPHVQPQVLATGSISLQRILLSKNLELIEDISMHRNIKTFAGSIKVHVTLQRQAFGLSQLQLTNEILSEEQASEATSNKSSNLDFFAASSVQAPFATKPTLQDLSSLMLTLNTYSLQFFVRVHTFCSNSVLVPTDKLCVRFGSFVQSYLSPIEFTARCLPSCTTSGNFQTVVKFDARHNLSLEPIVFANNLAEYMAENVLVIEVWKEAQRNDQMPDQEKSNLIGLCKVALHSLVPALLDFVKLSVTCKNNSVPAVVVAADSQLPVNDLISGESCGELSCIVGVGTAAAIQEYEQRCRSKTKLIQGLIRNKVIYKSNPPNTEEISTVDQILAVQLVDAGSSNEEPAIQTASTEIRTTIKNFADEHIFSFQIRGG